MVRLSEALAKAEFSSEVRADHVQEAHRLMKVSIFKTAINPETGYTRIYTFALLDIMLFCAAAFSHPSMSFDVKYDDCSYKVCCGWSQFEMYTAVLMF